MARILVVDDEIRLVQAVADGLRDEDHEILIASDGIEALSLARRHVPDLVILDILMPGLNGLDVCRRLRRDPAFAAIPILFLTGRGEVDDRILGLDEGADDYLVKPFQMKELKARVRALLRRSPSVAAPGQHVGRQPSHLKVAALTLDVAARVARVAEKTIDLTPIEFELLYHLMAHPGEVFSSEDLLQQVWHYAPGTGDPQLVRGHIKNVRAKLEPNPASPIYLRTAGRHGYVVGNLPSAAG